MTNKFIEIDTWFDPAIHYVGSAYLSDSGRPLSGYVERRYRHSVVRTLCSTGRHVRSYKYPRLPEAPEHRMVNFTNLLLCGGYSSSKYPNPCIADFVFAGTKPVGDMYFTEGSEDLRILLSRCDELGLQTIQQDTRYGPSTNKNVMFGVTADCGALFDLDNVIDYYQNATSRYSSGQIPTRLRGISGMSPVDALQAFDWSSPESDADLAVTGLCLGYALQSTVALINRTNW